MPFRRIPLEEWFDRHQYEVDYDIAESGVRCMTSDELHLGELSKVELRYGHHAGEPELRRLISKQYEDFKPDQICVTTGSSESNFCVIASLAYPSGHVIVEHPNYPSLCEVPRSLGLPHDYLRLIHEERFVPNFERLERLFKPKTKLVSLTHPNNPTGSVISERTLRDIIALVESHDAYLLHDEDYRELSYEKPPPPAAVLSDRAISMGTLSKAYGLAGMRIGWIAGPKEVIESVRAVREQITISNNVLAEAIARSILEEKDNLLKDIRSHIRRNFEILKQWMINQELLEWVEPQGGVVAFPRMMTGTSTEEICRLLVTKYRTLVVPGHLFEMNRHMRIGFGGSTDELNEGLKRLDLAMEECALQTNQ